ncbi:hypothetical protein ML462_15650 [Gramella lutea]|uniref:Lipoprotein n=1 Tax=Christiangramia lutea TaxID=1607951 RepID=A0A9X2ACZ0_9FLAO|nr:hypothetical protein [Christiangramia lutea]MCH4824608.1 hypothetical protein [Christiangramia lutea]
MDKLISKNFLNLIAILILLSSCGNRTDKKKITIEDFDKKFIDSLIPSPDKSYAVYYIKIKGTSNDTIRITASKPSDSSHYYYLNGNIEKEIRMDYYGGSKEYITFDPYKATKGKVELTYQL